MCIYTYRLFKCSMSKMDWSGPSVYLAPDAIYPLRFHPGFNLSSKSLKYTEQWTLLKLLAASRGRP
jgi:hypothetical protein